MDATPYLMDADPPGGRTTPPSPDADMQTPCEQNDTQVYPKLRFRAVMTQINQFTFNYKNSRGLKQSGILRTLRDFVTDVHS